MLLLITFSRLERYRGFGKFLRAASSSRREAMVGGVLARASALSVGLGVGGRSLPLGRVFAHRIRVMDGCVIWVRWVPHRYLGWYVGPGLSLRCFRLWFWFQECSSRNDTVTSATLPSRTYRKKNGIGSVPHKCGKRSENNEKESKLETVWARV
jgi:hypothetical protein